MSADSAVRRVLRWTDAEGRGLEHCLLTLDPAGLVLEGAVAGTRDGLHGAHYLLRADAAGRTRELRLRHVGGPDLHVTADEDGRWRDEIADHLLPELDGCFDVDLGFSPATNILPIRRLGLRVGQGADIVAAYAPLLSDALDPARLHPVVQRYTRTADRAWRFYQPDADFTADLAVDDLGAVRDYPGLFSRAAPE